VAGFDESGEAADGEEITNKIPKIEEALKTIRRKLACRAHEMCPIHADFKHFRGSCERISIVPQLLVKHAGE
jgi:hypothetical protein